MTLGKGLATGYSDFYKRTSKTPGAKSNKLESAAASSSPGLRPGSTSSFKNRSLDATDDEDEDEKKEAIRRRLKKFRKAGK